MQDTSEPTMKEAISSKLAKISSIFKTSDGCKQETKSGSPGKKEKELLKGMNNSHDSNNLTRASEKNREDAISKKAVVMYCMKCRGTLAGPFYSTCKCSCPMVSPTLPEKKGLFESIKSSVMPNSNKEQKRNTNWEDNFIYCSDGDD